MTDLLSPNKKDFEPMGAPRYLKVFLMSMICSVAVFAATNSEPYVAVSTVACFLIPVNWGSINKMNASS